MAKKTKKHTGKAKKVYEKPDILTFTLDQARRIVGIYLSVMNIQMIQSKDEEVEELVWEEEGSESETALEA